VSAEKSKTVPSFSWDSYITVLVDFFSRDEAVSEAFFCGILNKLREVY
jgi:hypothetical protein